VMRKVWTLFLNDQIETGTLTPLSSRIFDQHIDLSTPDTTMKSSLQKLLAPKIVTFKNGIKFNEHGKIEKITPDLKNAQYISEVFFVDVDIATKQDEARGLREVAIDEKTQPEAKIFYFDIFVQALEQLFEFAYTLHHGRYFSSLNLMMGIDELLETGRMRPTEQWHYLADAIQQLWLQFEKIDEDKARQAINDWLISPYRFFNCLGFTFLRNTTLFDAEAIFALLTEEDGRWLREHSVGEQIMRLLEARASQFSQSQIEEIEIILMRLADTDDEEILDEAE